MADLIFDGRCGFCARAVHLTRRLDRQQRICLHPYQRPGVTEEFGLTPEQVASAVWLLDDGQFFSGAAAINGILDVTLGARIFLRIYRVPGMKRLQDWIYRWIAENRHRLPGRAPWCEEHSEDCMGIEETGGSCGLGAPTDSGS